MIAALPIVCVALTFAACQHSDMAPKEALLRTFSSAPLRRNVAVAIVVGTVLNAINQGPELIAGHSPIIWKLLLTYCVPFAVASYGCYSALRTHA